MSAEPARRMSATVRSGELPPRLLERRGGALLVVLALTVGAVVLPGLGWLIGVILLWSSHAWSRIDKIIGTLVGPVGIALPFAARLFLPGDVINSPSNDCSAGGFCAPNFSTPWYFDIQTIGAVLVVVHVALGIYLLAWFRRGGIAAARTTDTALEHVR